MKVEKTYTELIIFNALAGIYLSENKDTENKLVSAIKTFNKQLTKIFEDYNDERDTLQLNNCLVDEKTKAILYDETGGQRVRRYTVEGELKLKKELKALGLTKVEVHARIPEGIDDLIAKLDDNQLTAFSGLVIPEQTGE